MANIAYDNSTANIQTGNFSFSYPTSGNNVLLLAKIRSAGTLGSPTYNGNAPTGTIGSQGGTVRFVYWLITTGGSFTFACTQSGVGGGNGLAQLVSYNGVAQLSFPDAGPITGSPNASVTSSAGGAWAVYNSENTNSSSITSTDTTRSSSSWSTGGATISDIMCDSNGSLGSGSNSFTSKTTTPASTSTTIFSIAPISIPYTATESDSIMNADSRFVTIISVKGKVRTMTDSMMNSVSRLATVIRSTINNRTISDNIMNADSRFTTVAKMISSFRTMTDSMMNSVSRLAILLFNRPPFWTKVSKPPESNWTPIEKGDA